MPIPPLKKRTYGYNHSPDENRKSRSYGDDIYEKKNREEIIPTEKSSKRTFKKKLIKNKKPLISIWWVKFLLLPFKLIGIILISLWKLWKIRPRLNKETRTRLRSKFIRTIITGIVLLF